MSKKKVFPKKKKREKWKALIMARWSISPSFIKEAKRKKKE
jgi:hypothetical protein